MTKLASSTAPAETMRHNPKVIRFEPPLIITRAEIDTVLGVFAAGVQDALDLLGDLI